MESTDGRVPAGIKKEAVEFEGRIGLKVRMENEILTLS
jgi:hypothetical protein